MAQELGDTSLPPNIRVLLSLVSSAAIYKAVTRVPPEYWERPAEELEIGVAPTETSRRIRAVFWSEVRGALNGEPVTMSKLATGAGLSYDSAHDLLTTDPALLAWILRPAPNDVRIEPLLGDLADKVGEIVDLPLKDKRGRVLTRNAKLILKAFEVLGALRNR